MFQKLLSSLKFSSVLCLSLSACDERCMSFFPPSKLDTWGKIYFICGNFSKRMVFVLFLTIITNNLMKFFIGNKLLDAVLAAYVLSFFKCSEPSWPLK